MSNPPQTSAPQTPATVLIVEDNPKNVQVLGTILMDAKYRVAVAQTGLVAFEQLPKVKPDLILLDIMMPGMDGFEICRRLKEDPATAGIPVIFLTAKTETEDIVRGFDLGAADFITKPFRAKELLARVQTHIALMNLQQNLKRKNEEIEAALANVKTLSELLPICAYCHRIRDDKNYWEDIEAYISGHTGSQFSHGVCPDCLEKELAKLQEQPPATSGPDALPGTTL